MEHILSSGFARGEKLPSESDLVRRFDVSRVTVRQALEALRAEGFIESRHGKGWFLRRICAVQNLGRLQGFGEMLAPMGVKVRSKVLDIKECAIPKAVAKAFGLPEQSKRDPDRAAADRRRPGDVLRSQLLPARHRPAPARAGSVAPGYFRTARARARHAARLRRRHDRDCAGGRRAGAAAWREACDADLQDDAPDPRPVAASRSISNTSTVCRNRICSRSGCRADDRDRPAPRRCPCWQRRCCRRARRRPTTFCSPTCPATSRRRSSRCPILSGKVRRLSDVSRTAGAGQLLGRVVPAVPARTRRARRFAQDASPTRRSKYWRINLGDSAERITTFLANYPAPNLPILLDADKTAAAPWHVAALPVAYARRPVRHSAARRHRRTRLALARHRAAAARVDRRLMQQNSFSSARSCCWKNSAPVEIF